MAPSPFFRVVADYVINIAEEQATDPKLTFLVLLGRRVGNPAQAGNETG